ncbi:RNA-binding S4 domain-containing protein [Eubacteriales bacterium OttesenSCG-928-N14]|nr:RNA-binding S4 domain-containing protein [Eubacteriales bacterium OttesenSCG-928-N14]
MRIDRYLKMARIIKRRTVAQEACDTGRVSINGKTAKAGDRVKEGDVIGIRFGENLRRYQVLTVEESVLKQGKETVFVALEENA